MTSCSPLCIHAFLKYHKSNWLPKKVYKFDYFLQFYCSVVISLNRSSSVRFRAESVSKEKLILNTSRLKMLTQLCAQLRGMEEIKIEVRQQNKDERKAVQAGWKDKHTF